MHSDNASGAPMEPRPGRLGSMYLPLGFTDLILRRRTDLGFTRDRHIKYASRLQPTCGPPSRRMAAGSVSLVAVLRDARNPSRRAPQVGHACLRMTCALLRTRLIDASIRFEPRKRSTSRSNHGG